MLTDIFYSLVAIILYWCTYLQIFTFYFKLKLYYRCRESEKRTTTLKGINLVNAAWIQLENYRANSTAKR